MYSLSLNCKELGVRLAALEFFQFLFKLGQALEEFGEAGHKGQRAHVGTLIHGGRAAHDDVAGDIFGDPDWGPMVTLSPMCKCPAIPTCPANVQLSPTVWNRKCPLVRRRSRYGLSAHYARSERDCRFLCRHLCGWHRARPGQWRRWPHLDGVAMVTLPTCGIFWMPAGVRAKPKPSAPSTEPGCRMHLRRRAFRP